MNPSPCATRGRRPGAVYVFRTCRTCHGKLAKPLPYSSDCADCASLVARISKLIGRSDRITRRDGRGLVPAREKRLAVYAARAAEGLPLFE